MPKKSIIPWEEWSRSNNKEMLDMLEDMPIKEQGIFMSRFLVEDSGYIMVPEDSFVGMQNVIIKYYSKWKKLEDKDVVNKKTI